jgi:hypothetical protein
MYVMAALRDGPDLGAVRYRGLVGRVDSIPRAPADLRRLRKSGCSWFRVNPDAQRAQSNSPEKAFHVIRGLDARAAGAGSAAC